MKVGVGVGAKDRYLNYFVTLGTSAEGEAGQGFTATTPDELVYKLTGSRQKAKPAVDAHWRNYKSVGNKLTTKFVYYVVGAPPGTLPNGSTAAHPPKMKV